MCKKQHKSNTHYKTNAKLIKLVKTRTQKMGGGVGWGVPPPAVTRLFARQNNYFSRFGDLQLGLPTTPYKCFRSTKPTFPEVQNTQALHSHCFHSFWRPKHGFRATKITFPCFRDAQKTINLIRFNKVRRP